MNLTRYFVIAGIATVPAWYAYRTASDTRTILFDWSFIEKLTGNSKPDEIQRAAPGQRGAACLAWIERVEAKYGELVLEQNRWREIEDLKTSPTGSAIAANLGYLRLFNELYRDLAPQTALQPHAATLRRLKAWCGEARRNAGTRSEFAAAASDLTTSETFLTEQLVRRREARSRITELALLAKGELPQTLDGAIRRQNVQDQIKSACFFQGGC